MRAAPMKERPRFPLMKQTDVQTISHMQMPRWLFSDPRYADMSLDAKVAYTFLLSRFHLSRRNGWVNDCGEVFVIFPRKELARELRICEHRVTAAFKTLMERKLVWEKRCGRGAANQIYLARVEPQADSCTPFLPEEESGCGARTADSEVPDLFLPAQEPQDLSTQNREICGSATAEVQVPEPRNPRPSYYKKSKKERSHTEVSPSVSPQTSLDRQTDDAESELMGILDACELFAFEPETARVFENAVERLFYSDSFRTGGAVLPRSRVRAKLHRLDCIILQDVERKLHANLDKDVKNSTAYVMAAIFNGITECESDLMVDPYLNSLRAPPEWNHFKLLSPQNSVEIQP